MHIIVGVGAITPLSRSISSWTSLSMLQCWHWILMGELNFLFSFLSSKLISSLIQWYMKRIKCEHNGIIPTSWSYQSKLHSAKTPNYRSKWLRYPSPMHRNFILQRVIRMNIPVYNIVIAEGIKHLYETLCTNKSGSYLVEQFLNTPFRSYVAEELLSSSKLIPIAQHEFGNYVIQKLIKRTKVILSTIFLLSPNHYITM